MVEEVNEIELKTEKLLGFPIPNGNFVKNPVIDNNKILVGDAAGKAGNIVTAAATGLVAVRDILDKIK